KQERMSHRTVAVQAFEVQLRGAGVAQRARTDMAVERRSIGRDVMGDELTKDRPAGGDTAERSRCIGEIAAVAQSPSATEGVKKRLVGCERREVRQHTRISGGPECGIKPPANP